MKHKGFLLATAGGLAMVPGAQAADMQVKAPVMVPPPATWTGWYIGLNAGVNWQNTNAFSQYSGESAHTDGNGFIGGGQIGYNWQHGNSVLGLEGDLSWLGGGSSAMVSSGTSPKGVSSKVNWLSTIRGRMGLAVGDAMIYATGGVAFGGVKNSYNPFGNTDPVGTKSESKTKLGWVVGGGIEHMWSPNFVIGLEALFVDLGKSTVTNPTNPLAVAPGFGSKTTTFSNQIVIGRVRGSYKF